ncbi:unnamed protein product [Somion occarium]|uniref:Major facilitator superfamily (MFS) profile domain-containing protein n=1 Tax=Somion occarium TaxID=3059160 RepID=A0ABP1DCN8_9APHY
MNLTFISFTQTRVMSRDDPTAGANEPGQTTALIPNQATALSQNVHDVNKSPSATVGDEKKEPDVERKETEDTSLTTPEKPYSAFTKTEKWLIVTMAAVGGLFSPLTSNSYFPAIPTMALAFNKSTELINLTVTVYMVLQGVAPMIWGPLADRWGRRLIFLACLFVLTLSCVGVALTPTNAYWLLMLLRCVQAMGSASTIALGAGVIADIAAQSERAGFYGIYSIGPMFGPCIGPVIGGALTQSLGWRSIFWFLSICSGVWFIIMLLFFPETLRAMVGDGSITAPLSHRPLIPILLRHQPNVNTERPSPKPLANPFRLFLNLDVDVLLFFSGMINAIFYGVIASISSLFTEVYPFLNETDIGLCFLSIGGGMLIGGTLTGKILDREYRNIKAKLVRKAQGQLDANTKAADTEADPPDVKIRDEDFPIEVARFRIMPAYLIISAIACVGYGWCLEKRVNIAIPLVLLFIMGFTVIGMMNTVQTLTIDLAPTQGSSITACNNLIRCSMGAVLVSIIDFIIKAVGIGWTYVILGALCFINFPVIFFIIYVGPKLRAKRRARQM